MSLLSQGTASRLQPDVGDLRVARDLKSRRRMMRHSLASLLIATTLGCGSDPDPIVDAGFVQLLAVDDDHFYFAMDDGEASGLYRGNLADGQKAQLLPMPVDAALRATLVGDQLYVHAGTDLWQVPAAGGKAFVIAEDLRDVEALAGDAAYVYIAGNSGIRALEIERGVITQLDGSGPAGRDGAYRRSGFTLAGRRLIWQGEGRDGVLAFDLDTLRRFTVFPIRAENSFDGTRGRLHTAEPIGVLAGSNDDVLFLYREMIIDGDQSRLDSAALYQVAIDGAGVPYVSLRAANLITATVHGDQVWGVRADGTVLAMPGNDVLATGLVLEVDEADALDLHLLATRSHLVRDQARSTIDAFELPAE
jgi:hypothetical protein